MASSTKPYFLANALTPTQGIILRVLWEWHQWEFVQISVNQIQLKSKLTAITASDWTDGFFIPLTIALCNGHVAQWLARTLCICSLREAVGSNPTLSKFFTLRTRQMMQNPTRIFST